MSPTRIGATTSGVRKFALAGTRHSSALLSELISPFAPTGFSPTVGPSLHDGTTIRSGVTSGLDTNRHAPRVFVLPSAAAAMGRIPSYENVPLRESLARQLAAVGAVAVADAASADVVLVIHTPDPARADHFGGDPAPDAAAIARTVAAVRTAVESGKPVALADLRYGNGGDAHLVDALGGLLADLDAYSGWNTAGNALGSVLALGVAAAVGRREGTLDEGARIRALKRRLLDDAVYQARVRRELSEELFGNRIEPVDAAQATRAEVVITDVLRDRLAGLGLPGSDSIASVTLPWLRSFEIDVLFEGETP